MQTTARNVEEPLATPRPRPRLVLMMPLRRCGSHALRVRLNASPAFYAPYPLHIVDFLPLVPLYGDLEDDTSYFDLVRDVVGLQVASPVKWPKVVFDPVEVFEATKAQRPRSVHRVVGELLLRAGEAQGAAVVLDKSLDTVHQAEELLAIYPDMLFLNVVRDPRGQVASMNKAIIHDFDTELNARTWVKAYEAAQGVLARHPSQVLTVRFEDLLNQEEATMRRVCAFFGIDFLPGMLEVTRSAEAADLSRRSALWESNCFSPIPANATKFKQSLSMNEIAGIERLTAKFMAQYGYERMTPAAPEGNGGRTAEEEEETLALARARSEERKAQAWRDMRAQHYQDYALRKFRADYITDRKRALLLEQGPVKAGVGGQ